MNRITLMLTFVFLITSICMAQQSDYEKIEETLWNYLNGDTKKDYETLKKAFHEESTIKYISSSDGYTAYQALEAFKDIQGRTPETNRINRIEYISIAGNAASAKIEVEYPNAVVVDFMNLLKVNGEWKIVGKIFSKK